jgi:hypothetical protein
MAYGKIKSDTLVYDNSGTDVEIAISSIPTASDLAAKASTSAEQTFTAGQRGEITELAAGTSFTIDLDASNNFLIQPNGTYTVTLSNVSGAKGQCGSIFIKPTAAAASGSFPTTMKFVGGAAGIALTGTSGSIDRIDYIVQNDSAGYECLTCNFTANYVA